MSLFLCSYRICLIAPDLLFGPKPVVKLTPVDAVETIDDMAPAAFEKDTDRLWAHLESRSIYRLPDPVPARKMRVLP